MSANDLAPSNPAVAAAQPPAGQSGHRECVAVVGTGQIAVSMAVLMTGNGCPTFMFSRSESSTQRARQAYDAYFSDLVAAGLLTPVQVQRCAALLTIGQDMAGVAEADYIIESVYEQLETKQAVYREIEAVCRPDTVIASMTSGITPDRLAAGMTHPERLLVAHPFVPPHLVPCIEVVGSAWTAPAAIARTIELFESAGRAVIVLRKSIDGFIANRLQHAMFREAVYLVDQGVATAEDIDRTLLTSFGPRYSAIGIFEHMENAGLDMCASIQAYLLPTLCSDTDVQPAITARVAAGELGSKSGRGFLDWSGKDLDDLRVRRSQPYFKFFNWNLPE